VARELHDDVTQRLAALALDCATLERTLDGTSPARDGLRRIREETARLSEDVQALSRELHPSIVEDLGLAAAADALCTRVSQRDKTAVRFLQTGEDDGLPRDTAVCLYRVLQEGLRNVTRHARATQVTVTLDVGGRDASLRVEDDGVGFEAGEPSRGLGLSSMRERVALVEGQLRLHSRPGEGTEVVARVPARGAAHPRPALRRSTRPDLTKPPRKPTTWRNTT
jgi:signal transduction histidine kinase